ncbi:MAG: protein-methionine-sulfoxide reductase heme-binding subunit MsrQ [Pseudomonadota bacterium]
MALKNQINSALRRVPPWLLYFAALGYTGWMLWLGVNNQLGADPVKALEHKMGEMALYFLVVGLCVTPLKKITGVNLMKYRRAIGLVCFFFVAMHLLVWAVLDVQRLSAVWADIVKRPYITVGMASFVILLPLAITSNNYSIRKLGGAAWANLHKMIYPAAILGGLHYVMLVKGWQIRPMIFLGIILALIAWRYWSKRPARRVQASSASG